MNSTVIATTYDNLGILYTLQLHVKLIKYVASNLKRL